MKFLYTVHSVHSSRSARHPVVVRLPKEENTQLQAIPMRTRLYEVYLPLSGPNQVTGLEPYPGSIKTSLVKMGRVNLNFSRGNSRDRSPCSLGRNLGSAGLFRHATEIQVDRDMGTLSIVENIHSFVRILRNWTHLKVFEDIHAVFQILNSMTSNPRPLIQ